MALAVRLSDRAVLMALLSTHNTKSVTRAGAFFHYDISSLPAAGSTEQAPTSTPDVPLSATPTDLPSSITAVNELQTIFLRHGVDVLAHKVADSAEVATIAAVPVAVDQGTVDTLANALKAAWNTHIASTTYHPNADSTNAIGAANATNLSTGITLITALQAAFINHIESGNASPLIKTVPA